MANDAQLAAWQGESGQFWAAHDERYDAMLAGLTNRLLDALSIAPGERVLDVGCGCGRTTRLSAERSAPGDVLGVDLSTVMLDQARTRALTHGTANVRFEQADAQTHRFPSGAFDVAMSQLGVMFFDDAPVAFANLAEALRPGGRLGFVCWRERDRNLHRTVPQAALAEFVPIPQPAPPGRPGAFSLADPDRVRDLLTRAGFESIHLAPLAEQLLVGADVADGAQFMVIDSLPAAPPAETIERAEAALREALAPYATPAGVLLDSAAWLVTARRPVVSPG